MPSSVAKALSSDRLGPPLKATLGLLELRNVVHRRECFSNLYPFTREGTITFSSTILLKNGTHRSSPCGDSRSTMGISEIWNHWLQMQNPNRAPHRLDCDHSPSNAVDMEDICYLAFYALCPQIVEPLGDILEKLSKPRSTYILQQHGHLKQVGRSAGYGQQEIHSLAGRGGRKDTT